MISIEDLVGLITSKIADAEVNVMDRTGMKDHFMIHVTSEIFRDLDLMARHRAVQEILTPAMQDGRIHAVEIKTATPE